MSRGLAHIVVLLVCRRLLTAVVTLFQNVGVEYRQLKPKSTEWSRMYVGDVTDTQLAIRHLDNDEYELKVTAINNEGIRSSSQITNAALSPGEW